MEIIDILQQLHFKYGLVDGDIAPSNQDQLVQLDYGWTERSENPPESLEDVRMALIAIRFLWDGNEDYFYLLSSEYDPEIGATPWSIFSI